MNSASNNRLSLVLSLTGLIAPALVHAAATVTLTSPTETPTWVVGGSNYGGSQSFQSTDTTPFDQTASRSGGDSRGGAGGTSHLALTVASQEIRTAFDGGCGASIQFPGSSYAASNYAARFSLDIVVDTLTPFFLEVQTSAGGSSSPNPNGSYQSDITYYFYTPNSNLLNVSFGTKAGAPKGGPTTGVMVPGETYRFRFEAGGSANTGQVDVLSANASGIGSAVLVIPEPGSLALLLAAVAIYGGRPRRL